MAFADVATGPPATAAVTGDADEKPKRGKAAKEPKAKKPTAPRKPRSPSSHPPFLVMITEAIVALKERTGSSQQAITKFIEAKEKNLPANFRKLLLVQLKRLVASGKLVKIKNSFKLPPARSSPLAATAGKSVPAKKKTEKKATATAKSKSKSKAGAVTGVKRKATTAKTEGSPAKKVKRSTIVGRPKKAVAAEATKKNMTPVKSVRKPKSVKSPVKKTKSVKSPAKRGKK